MGECLCCWAVTHLHGHRHPGCVHGLIAIHSGGVSSSSHKVLSSVWSLLDGVKPAGSRAGDGEFSTARGRFCSWMLVVIAPPRHLGQTCSSQQLLGKVWHSMISEKEALLPSKNNKEACLELPFCLFPYFWSCLWKRKILDRLNP